MILNDDDDNDFFIFKVGFVELAQHQKQHQVQNKETKCAIAETLRTKSTTFTQKGERTALTHLCTLTQTKIKMCSLPYACRCSPVQ